MAPKTAPGKALPGATTVQDEAPRPRCLTMREFRANLGQIMRDGAPVVVRRSYRDAALFVPLDVRDWESTQGLRATVRKRVKNAVAILRALASE